MTIRLPGVDQYDDYDWWIAESKGYIEDLEVEVDGTVFTLSVYDPVRLAQDIADDLQSGYFPHWERIVVVRSVTPSQITAAIDSLPASFFAQ